MDGRYAASVKELSVIFSESSLMRYRVMVEVEYLIALGSERGIKEIEPFTNTKQTKLRNIYRNFNVAAAQKIKKIELSTNHDVKAVEYFLQSKMKKTLHPWIHFALTSEDVNNLAYSLMWRDGLKQAYLPVLYNVNRELKKLARRYKNSPTASPPHQPPSEKKWLFSPEDSNARSIRSKPINCQGNWAVPQELGQHTKWRIPK